MKKRGIRKRVWDNVPKKTKEKILDRSLKKYMKKQDREMEKVKIHFTEEILKDNDTPEDKEVVIKHFSKGKEIKSKTKHVVIKHKEESNQRKFSDIFGDLTSSKTDTNAEVMNNDLFLILDELTEMNDDIIGGAIMSRDGKVLASKLMGELDVLDVIEEMKDALPYFSEPNKQDHVLSGDKNNIVVMPAGENAILVVELRSNHGFDIDFFSSRFRPGSGPSTYSPSSPSSPSSSKHRK